MQQYLQQDIQFLQGVGPKRADLLRQELNINTVDDLLTYYPYRYVDRSRFYKISEVTSDMPFIQIIGRIKSYATAGKGRGKRLVADFTDESGHMELVWFRGAKWIPENYPVGKELVVFGRPSVYQRKLNVVHPELEDPEKKACGQLQTTGGLLHPAAVCSFAGPIPYPYVSPSLPFSEHRLAQRAGVPGKRC